MRTPRTRRPRPSRPSLPPEVIAYYTAGVALVLAELALRTAPHAKQPAAEQTWSQS